MRYPVVSVDDVARQLTHEEVVLFDCRFQLSDPDAGRTAYEHGHLPGAHYADLEKDLSGTITPALGRHPLPRAEDFAAFLARHGVERGQLIVAYDDNMGFASRFWWLCRYFGWDNVAVLDGGIRAWQNAGLPLSTQQEIVRKTSSIKLTPRPQLAIDLPELRERLTANGAEPILIDSRHPERYCGIHEPLDPAAGHIPGARCLFWQECLNDDGFWQSQAWHEARWSDFNDAPLVVYCGSGVTACVNMLSLACAERFAQARLYVGSWSQWATWHLERQIPESEWLARCTLKD